jgi:hypothetical protein
MGYTVSAALGSRRLSLGYPERRIFLKEKPKSMLFHALKEVSPTV